MTVICMNFFVFKGLAWICCIVMIKISIYSHHIYVLVLLDRKSFIDILVSSEIRRLIHVKPNA